jgi:hypothetical protein
LSWLGSDSEAALFFGSKKLVTRVYDEAGNVIETHEQKDDFKEP